MPSHRSYPKPYIPAAIRKLGATTLDRFRGSCGWNTFALSFESVGDDYTQPGKGHEIVDALRKHFGSDVDVAWTGHQAHAITLTLI